MFKFDNNPKRAKLSDVQSANLLSYLFTNFRVPIAGELTRGRIANSFARESERSRCELRVKILAFTREWGSLAYTLSVSGTVCYLIA